MREFQKTYYSQGGEDIILLNIFKHLVRVKEGFYVDAGAFHPYKYSNTALLYEQGWRGINIDPCPGCMELFEKERPGDINLEIGVSNKEETLTYYEIEGRPAANSFSPEFLKATGNFQNIARETPIKTKTLEQILDKHLPEGKSIDLLNVDVEGYDYQVLSSNDWKEYRPKVIIVELNSKTFEEVLNSQIIKFMKALNYGLVAKTVVLPPIASVFLVDRELA